MDKDSSYIKNEIEVTLLTDLPEEFQISNNRMSIPTSYDTESLRKLIKKLLKIPDSNKNFIFFIDNKLLDATISSFIANDSDFDIKKISETGLEIVYAFETEEPKLVNTIKEDEWIKKISIRLNQKSNFSEMEYYCVGLFNSEISIFNKNFEKVLKIEEPELERNKKENYCELLHDVLFFKPHYPQTENLNENILIKCSRNEDYNFQIYAVDLTKMTYNQLYLEFKQNTEYVNTLSLNPVDYSYFTTGDTEGNIKFFKLPENVDASEDLKTKSKSKKKRKIEVQSLEAESVIENCHSEVKIVKWLNNQQILTSGDDFSIKLWNIQTKSNFSVFNTNYRYTTAICPILGNEKFLTGFDDGSIRLWDIRANFSKIYFPNAHSNYVSDIVVSPDPGHSSNIFSSVGYDGMVKVWDLRSTKKALIEIKTDSEKNYSVTYNSSNYLLTGGDNSSVNVYQC